MTDAITSRINGHAHPATKKGLKAKPIQPKRAARPKRSEVDHLNRWATSYVALSAAMSMVLNAMANCHHAQDHVVMAGAMGAWTF